MKILLVEDDESLASLLIQLLKMQHHQVDLATDGQTGWELANAFSYDLLLLDVMIPVLDGISFCQQWRTTGDLTPILFLTALGSQQKQSHRTGRWSRRQSPSNF